MPGRTGGSTASTVSTRPCRPAPGQLRDPDMIDRPESEPTPLDDAARAGWLYYVAGLTQDQIARELGTSRQRAQRLVSRAISERLIHVRLEHRVSGCLHLEAALIRRFGLKLARVAPSLGSEVDPLPSIAPTAAAEGGAGAALGAADGGGLRHRPVAARHRRGDDLDGLRAAQDRVAQREYLGGWLGLLLRCDLPHRRPCARRTIRCRCPSSRRMRRSGSCFMR